MRQKPKSRPVSAFPRLGEIEDEIHSAGFRYNKAILMGTVPAGSAVDELSDTIEELRKRT